MDEADRGWWPVRTVRAGLNVLSPWDVLLLQVRAYLRAAFLRRTRRELMDLTDEQLRDIGITREAANAEARRSVHIL